MNRVFVLTIILFSFCFCRISFGDTIPNDSLAKLADSCFINHYKNIDSAICYASQFMGVPYKYGGRNEKGFDCSGFMKFIFDPFGIDLPYTSKAYANIGKEVSASEAQKGDFALFKGRNASVDGIGHVGLIIDVDENGNIYILHATIHKGINIDNITNQDYYQKRFLSIRRIDPPCEIF